MFKIKYKLLLTLLLFMASAGQLVFITPNIAYANHDTCSETEPLATSCRQKLRNEANVLCYENNAGKNDAIAACVEKVTAHFVFQFGGGSAADAPPLPSEATAPAPANLEGDCKDGDNATGTKDGKLDKSECGILAYIVDIINILSALVGIISVIMIAVWGIQYTVARDNPQMVATARLRLVQTVLALVAYLFVYAFLQWIVPGGVF